MIFPDGSSPGCVFLHSAGSAHISGRRDSYLGPSARKAGFLPIVRPPNSCLSQTDPEMRIRVRVEKIDSWRKRYLYRGVTRGSGPAIVC